MVAEDDDQSDAVEPEVRGRRRAARLRLGEDRLDKARRSAWAAQCTRRPAAMAVKAEAVGHARRVAVVVLHVDVGLLPRLSGELLRPVREERVGVLVPAQADVAPVRWWRRARDTTLSPSATHSATRCVAEDRPHLVVEPRRVTELESDAVTAGATGSAHVCVEEGREARDVLAEERRELEEERPEARAEPRRPCGRTPRSSRRRRRAWRSA
jgi:hypothetical protein